VRDRIATRIRFAARLGLALCTLALLLSGTAASAQTTVVTFGSTHRYLANSSDPGIGLSWVESGFDDFSWTIGNYGVGFDTAHSAQDMLQTTTSSGVK
jgi:hypothetical protein